MGTRGTGQGERDKGKERGNGHKRKNWIQN
jgi:hypothetical protein